MKKLMLLLTLILTVFSLSACNFGDPGNGNDNGNGNGDPGNGETVEYTLTLESALESAEFNLDEVTTHEEGSEIEISVDYPEAEYNFVEWSYDGTTVSDTATFTFTIEEDTTLTAVFSPIITAEPAVYLETFEDFYATGSQYRDFTHVGVNGIEWHFTATRTDLRFDNVSYAVTFHRTSQASASLQGSVPEGVRYLSVYYENAFSTPAG